LTSIKHNNIKVLAFDYDNLLLENIAQVLLLQFKFSKNVPADCLIEVNIPHGR